MEEDYENIEQVPTDTERIYKRDLAYFATPMPCDDIVAKARQGDKDAKERIVTGLLNVICGYAARRQMMILRRNSGYVDPHTDFMDLVCTGNAILVEKLEEALCHPNPVGYLLKTAWNEMSQERSRYRNAISTPNVPGDYHYYVLSLSMNFEEFDETIADTETLGIVDYTPLYAALAQLPERVQNLLARLYGMENYGVEPLSKIAGGDSTTKAYQNLKMVKLRSLGKIHYILEKKYPAFCQRFKDTPIRRRIYEDLRIPECTLEKLREAEATLKAQGTKISMNKLRQISGVNTRYASAYLQKCDPALVYERPPKKEKAFHKGGEQICPQCGGSFVPALISGGPKRYCSDRCRQRTRYLKRRNKEAKDNSPTSLG